MRETLVPEPRADASLPNPLPLAGIRARGRDVTRADGGTARSRELSPPDEELMARMGTGGIDALEQVYDRYSALVFSVGLRVLNDRQLAEDVVQEVFLRLWRGPSSYDPARGRFISWLMSVTRNRALDELRRVTRRRRLEDQEEEPTLQLASQDLGDDPELGLVLEERRRAVRDAMTRLPPPQRRVLELAYFSGLTQVEIAERTGDPLGTVKTRVRLGMQRLREALAEVLDEAENGGPG